MKRFFVFSVFLSVMFSGQAQYMSFFGDSTWEYHSTYLTNPPEDYLNYPPESQPPTPLNAYCRTMVFSYDKGSFDDSTHHYLTTPHGGYVLCHSVYEDTVYGRLYVDSYCWADYPQTYKSILVCDMSLSEGDTFVLEDNGAYPGPNYAYQHWDYDTIGDRSMVVDSVRYIDGRKNIFLSLIDHQDDYFFGTDYAGQLSNHDFTIRFIEGIGPTYGLLPGRRAPHGAIDLHPSLGLMLCMYKDGTLVYMADENLGCDQTCVGVEEHSPLVTTVYPNPTDDHLHIELSGGEIAKVALYDLQGRVVTGAGAHAGAPQRGGNVTINMRSVPAGVYLLRVTGTDGKEYQRKIVKR